MGACRRFIRGSSIRQDCFRSLYIRDGGFELRPAPARRGFMAPHMLMPRAPRRALSQPRPAGCCGQAKIATREGARAPALSRRNPEPVDGQAARPACFDKLSTVVGGRIRQRRARHQAGSILRSGKLIASLSAPLRPSAPRFWDRSSWRRACRQQTPRCGRGPRRSWHAHEGPWRSVD